MVYKRLSERIKLYLAGQGRLGGAAGHVGALPPPTYFILSAEKVRGLCVLDHQLLERIFIHRGVPLARQDSHVPYEPVIGPDAVCLDIRVTDHGDFEGIEVARTLFRAHLPQLADQIRGEHRGQYGDYSHYQNHFDECKALNALARVGFSHSGFSSNVLYSSGRNFPPE